MVASLDLCLLLLRDTATGPPVAVETPCITNAMGPQVCLSKRVKGHGGVSEYQKGGHIRRTGVYRIGQGGTRGPTPHNGGIGRR